MAATPLIIFDVNETLLDLETLTPAFERIFHERSAMRMWFANLILYSEALTLAQVYVPFTEIGEAVLQMMADTHGVRISAQDKSDLTNRFATLPPHPEVPQALTNCALQDFAFLRLLTIY